MSVIERIRKKIRDGDYEFTIPHFFEEMAEDNLILLMLKEQLRMVEFVTSTSETLAERGTKL